MAYNTPDIVVDQMIAAGARKAQLPVRDLLIRGVLSGALLGFATTLAFSAAGQTGLPIVGALLFPAGFVMIVLLGLELVTGNFALLPVAVLDGKAGWTRMLANWGWVFAGNLLGSLLYMLLFVPTLPEASPIAQQLVTLAEAKTVANAALGWEGMQLLLLKAVLCNWMVTLGVVMALTSQSTFGKIAAMWLPIMTFFAQGFEHSVVNMFVIPAGMMLGARVSIADWWLWNQIPVTLGNLVGGAVFTGLALYITHRKRAAQPATSAPSTLARESEPVAG